MAKTLKFLEKAIYFDIKNTPELKEGIDKIKNPELRALFLPMRLSVEEKKTFIEKISDITHILLKFDEHLLEEEKRRKKKEIETEDTIYELKKKNAILMSRNDQVSLELSTIEKKIGNGSVKFLSPLDWTGPNSPGDLIH